MSTEDLPSAEVWIAAYAAKLGLTCPTDTELEQLLDLAGVAAHASERQAAPITTWLAAQAGLSPERALAVAKDLAAQFG